MVEVETTQRSGGHRRGTWRRRIGFALYCTVVVLVLIEVAVRILSDEGDGQLMVRGLKLVPLAPVSPAHRRILETDAGELPYVIPDRELGWTIRPDGHTADGLFASNEVGLRSAPAPVGAKVDGQTRVLLVGDSYTHGDEVSWSDTWAHRLAEELGPQYEVLNGGVGGYGTDQAVLRARRLSPRLSPDVVILGIYIQDMLRNLTVFRSVKHPWTHYPWSKPRFVIDDKDTSGLRLINFPVTPWPPRKVIEVLEDYDSHPELHRNDRLWNHALHRDSWTYSSRLWRWITSRKIHRDRHEDRQQLLRDRNEGVVVAARIARLFQVETTAAGARPIIALFPGPDGLPGYAEGKHPPLRHLHAELERLGVKYTDVGRAMLDRLATHEDARALYLTSHPTPRANRIIATTLAPHIR
ncbi:MAG: GDSL-type esterase/lipase family protein [Planctomycetota bacterium]|nr:GDSL-type esterase/lipase family protein [Planctomycetota bacterium]